MIQQFFRLFLIISDYYAYLNILNKLYVSIVIALYA